MVAVNWRGSEYEFEYRTRGRLNEKETRNSTIDAPIWGADTESVLCGDRYEVQCIQLSGAPFGQALEWLPHKESAIKLFCTMAARGWVAEREPNHIICYFHNLEYDWLQLIKDNEKALAMTKVGVSPETETPLFQIGSWAVSIDKNCIFTGSAPSIRLRFKMFQETKKKVARNFTLQLMDTWSYFPSSLQALAQTLGLAAQKEERQADLGLRDYRKEGDSADKQDFEHYAKADALVTRLAGEKIRELHQLHNLTKIRPSAPSYAIAVLYAELPEGIRIQNASYEIKHIQIALDAYRGGRTGGIYHGRVEKLSVLDFHSSYPASMCSLPSFTERMAYMEVEDLSLDNVMEILAETGNAFLRVSGRETDARYPSLLTTVGNKLCPVYGEFENIATTGYEFYSGVMSGGLQDIVIHECLVLADIDEEPYLPFREFAQSGYHEKANSPKGSLSYIAAKLKLNSAYGKLIESRAQNLLGLTESNLMFPYLDGMEKEFAQYYYSSYLEHLENDSNEMEWFTALCDFVYDEFGTPETEWLYSELPEFNIGGYVYGQYVIPAAASLITGCSRARLLCAAKATGAIYWDTDSIFVEGRSVEEISYDLTKTAAWLPENAIAIEIGEELGQMDIEMTYGRGWLAGTKRYYLEPTIEGENPKIATHGVPALNRREARDLIESLATGRDYEYNSRAKPTKAKEAKSANEIGLFRSKHYKPLFRLDDRIDWTETETGWLGTIKEFDRLTKKENQKQQELEQMRLDYIDKLKL